MARFVNIDGVWLNPSHVVSVEGANYSDPGNTPVFIKTVAGTHEVYACESEAEASRQACVVVDKLEAVGEEPVTQEQEPHE